MIQTGPLLSIQLAQLAQALKPLSPQQLPLQPYSNPELWISEPLRLMWKLPFNYLVSFRSDNEAGGHRPTNLPERKINGLPTPQNLRFCQDKQFSALWNVNDSTVQITAPDMLIGFQAQFITLSGVYTMEMNRFDAFTHHRNWAPEHPPSVHQRKLLTNYLCFVLSQWPEEDVQGHNSPSTSTSKEPGRPIINQIFCPGLHL